MPDRKWDMSVISNSETAMYRTCERKHFYAFGERLQPKKQGHGLSRGILGHDVLAEYYSQIKGGALPVDAKVEALKVMDVAIAEAVINDQSAIDWLVPLRTRIDDYFTHAPTVDDFDILEVESEYRITLPSGMEYAMRLDLLVRPRSGKYVGQKVLMDHKFVWDFYKEDAITMNPQLPKYIGILRANGIGVDVAYFNQIRTRVNKGPMETDAKFRRSLVIPDKNEIRTMFREELITAEKLDGLRALPVDEWRDQITRNLGNMTCPFCSFQSICKTEMLDQDSTLVRIMDYEETKYGYSEPTSD